MTQCIKYKQYPHCAFHLYLMRAECFSWMCARVTSWLHRPHGNRRKDAGSILNLAVKFSFLFQRSRRRRPGGPVSCVRSSANTEPGFQTSRTPSRGNKWRALGSKMWWSWCCWEKIRNGCFLYNLNTERLRWGVWVQVHDVYQSPCWISCLFLPSNDTQAVFLASGDKVICFRGKEG